MKISRRKTLQLFAVGSAGLLLRNLVGCDSGTSPFVDISILAFTRRVRLLHYSGTEGARGFLNFGSTNDPGDPTGLRLYSTRGRVRFEISPDQPGEIYDNVVSGRINNAGQLLVWIIPLAVGEPEEPGDVLVVESRHGVFEIEVWIEPQLGQWRDRPDGNVMELGIVGVHAALLRSEQRSQVLLFSPPRRRRRDGSFEMRNGQFVWNLHELHDVEIKSVNTSTFQATDVSMQASGLNPINLFCVGHSHLSNGQLLMAGGHISTNSITDPNADWVHVFNPTNQGLTWIRAASRMRNHRWYPTLTTLSDGRILITSGSSQALTGLEHIDHWFPFGFYHHIENNYEIFDPNAMVFVALDPSNPQLVDLNQDEIRAGNDENRLATYPAVFVLPGDTSSQTSVVFIQEANRGWLYKYLPEHRAPLVRALRKYRMVATSGSRSYPHYGSAVLLPFQDGATEFRILVLGGQEETATDHQRLDHDQLTTATAEVFDYNVNQALDNQTGWRRVGDMHHRRLLCDATLLPDGKILVTGGVSRGWSNNNRARDATLEAELFDPIGETFQLAAPARHDRRYHATALLLPDATVLKTGSTGGFEDGLDPDGTSWIQPHFVGERFLPSYLWRGRRPQVRIEGLDLHTTIRYGALFQVDVQGEDLNGARIAVLRLGAVTHGLDMDQRCIWLNITEQRMNSGRVQLDVLAPSSSAVAPPGDYMLFVLSGIDVPSHAWFVRFLS